MADESTVSELKAKISVEGADDAQRVMNQLHGKTNETGNAFQRALGTVSGFVAGFGIMKIADAAVGILVGKMHDWIQGAEDAQVAQAQTNQILASGSHVIGLTSGMVDQLANKYMNLTGVDDDVIHSAENILAGFQNISLKAFPDAIQQSINLAESFKMLHGGTVDVTRASQILGRALEDPSRGARMLRQYNIILSQSQQDQIKAFMKVNDVADAQAIIMDAVRSKVGGAADAFGATAEGKMMRFNTAMDNIGKTLASVALPAFSDLLDAVNPFIYAVANGLGPVVDSVRGAFANLTTYLSPLRVVFSSLGDLVSHLADVFSGSFGQAVRGAGDGFKKMLPDLGMVAANIDNLIEQFATFASGPIAALGQSLGSLVKGGLGALKDILTGPIAASVRSLADNLRGQLLPVVQNVGTWFANTLVPTLKAVAPQFASLASAIGGILVPILGFLYIKFTELEGFLAANVIPIFEAILPPIIQFAGFLAGALSDGIKTISSILGPLIANFAGVNEQVKTVKPPLEEAGKVLGEKVGPAAKSVAEHVQRLSDTARTFATEVGTRLTPIVNGVRDTFTRVAPPVATFANAVGVRLQPILKNVGIFIQTVVMPILQALGQVFAVTLTSNLTSLQTIWNTVWPSISNVLQVAWDIIQTIVQVAWDTISGTVLIGLDILGGNWKQAWTDMQNEFKGISDAINGLGKRLMTDLWNTVQQIGKNVQTTFANLWKGIQDNTSSALKGLKDNIAKIVGGLPDFFKHLGEQMIQALADAIRNGVGAIGDALKHLFEMAFKNLPGGWHIPGFAEGTNNAPGGLARVGEGKYAELVIGPHLMNLERGSQVVPINLSGNAASSGSAVHQHFAAGAIVINGAGMSAEEIHSAWMQRAAFLARGRGNG